MFSGCREALRSRHLIKWVGALPMRGKKWYGTNQSSAGLLYISKFLGLYTFYHCQFVNHSHSLRYLARARYNLGSNSQYQGIAYGFSTSLNHNLKLNRRMTGSHLMSWSLPDVVSIVRIVPASIGGIGSAIPLESLVADLTNNSYFGVLLSTTHTAPPLEIPAASYYRPDPPERHYKPLSF